MASTGNIFKITGVSPDTGTVTNDGITNATSLTLSGSNATNGQEVQIYINGTSTNNFVGDATLASQNSSSWTFKYDFSKLGDGTYTVNAYDVGSNTWATYTVTIDTAPDAAPTVAITTDANSDGWIKATEQGSATTDSIKVSFGSDVKVGDIVTLTSNTGTSTTYTLTANDIANHFWNTTVTKPAEGGTLNVSATLKDAAGNISAAGTAKATLDTTAPAAPTVTLTHDTGSSSTDGITKDGSLNVTGVETGAAVQYSTNGGSTWSSSFTASEGTNSVLVRQTDVAGNVGASASFSFTLDTTAPTAPTVALSHDTGTSNSDHITSNGALSVSGTESGATVQYSTNGGSTWSSSFTASEGTNSVLVRQTDVAGNVGASASFSFTLDTTAPSAPTVALAHDTGSSSGDNITNNGALTIGGTESGASVQYSVDGGSTWHATFSAVEGSNSVLVRQTDVAGNVGASAGFSFTLDTTAPSAPTVALATDSGSSQSDGITNNGALHVGGLESGASVQYSVDGGNTWSNSFAAVEGANSVLVRQTDVAGNAGSSASFSFTLDTTVPSAPTVTLTHDTGSSGSDHVTNNGALTLTGVESGASVQYSADGGNTWSNGFTASEGGNTVLVHQIDAAGNVGASSSLSFTLDTTIPVAPAIALASDTGSSDSDHVTSNGALAVTGTESGATVEYSLDGGHTWTGSFTATEGANDVLVRQTDVAGNVSTASSLSFILDTHAPIAPTLVLAADTGALNNDHITSNGTVTLSGVEAGASVEYSVDGGHIWSGSFTAAEGANDVLVRQSDVAGNVSASSSLNFTLDTVAPDALAVALAHDTGASDHDSLTNDGALAVSGVESGAAVAYSTDGGQTWSGSFTATEGSNTVLVHQTDAAGNVSEASSLSFTLDTTAPVAPSATLASDTGSSNNDHVTSNGAINLTGLEDGASAQYSTDGGHTWTNSFTAAEGANNLMVRQIDAAGNAGDASSLSFTLDTIAPDAPTMALAADTGTSDSDGITNNGTVVVDHTEQGAAVQYSIDGGNTWSDSFTATEGSNSVQVRQMDVAGNAGAATSLSFTLDTVAPDAPAVALASDTGTSASDHITSSGALSLTGVESGASVAYSVDGGNTWNTSFTAAEGINNVLVRQTDVAGNVGNAASLSFTLDTTAPDAPGVTLAHDTGASGSDHVTNDGALNVTGIESGATVEYSTDGGHSWSDSFAAVEGENSILVRQTDVAGNVGAAASLGLTLDTTAPDAPTVVLASDTGASSSDFVTNNGAITVGGLESGATVQYSVDGGNTWSDSFTAAEGANSVEVRQMDVASNAGAASSLSFTLDTTAPVAPGVALATDTGSSDSDHVTSNGALAVTGTESGATVEYSIDGGHTWSIGFTAVEGANDVLVRQTDVAGNIGASAELSFTVDTVAPNAPVVALTSDTGSSNNDGITKDGSLTLTGVENGATVEYSTDGGNTWSASFTATEGANSVEVRQTDVAGNVGAATSLAFTLDTIAPDAVAVALSKDSGASGSDGITNNGALNVSGVESGATVEYSVDGGNTWSSSFAATEGINTVVLRQTDAAGNVSATSSLSFTLDTSAPAAPTVALTTDSGSSHSDSITNVGTLNISGLENGATVEYSVDNGNTWAGSFTATEGSNSVLVRQTDLAGNVGVAANLNFTLDTAAPTAPSATLAVDSGSSHSDGITNNGAINVTGLESGATVQYSVDGGNSWTGSFSATEGANNVLVRQSDVAGNVSTTSSLSFTLDTQAPAAVTLALASDTGSSNSDHITSNGTIALSGLESGATVQYSVDGGNTWTGSFTATEGSNSVLVHQVDVAGNTGTASSLSFTLDTIAPNAPSVALAVDSGISNTDHITNNGTINVSGVESGATVQYSVDGGHTWTSSFTAVQGANTVQVHATDLAGNTSNASSLSFTLDTTAATPTFTAAQLNGTSSTMTMGGLAEAGAVVTIYDLTSGKVAGTATANAGGAWSFTSGKVSGIHAFNLSLTDAAGNVGHTTAEAIIGTMGAETIKDVAGQNDILSGAQGLDTFAFSAGFGNDVITDFIPGSGTHEMIQFSKSSFATFTAMMSHAQQVGTNVVIADGVGDSLTLVGINIADLKTVDFSFV